jgi:hypothetical protein
MSTYLHQIFYKYNKFDHIGEAIDALGKFMYVPVSNKPSLLVSIENDEAEHLIKEPVTKLRVNVVKENSIVAPTRDYVREQNDRLFSPVQPDTLFWCIFIAHYEYAEYEMVRTRYHNKEIEEKQRIMETIRKTPDMIKAAGIKMTKIRVQQCLSELMVDQKTTLQTCLVMCVYYKIRIFLIYKHTFLEYNHVENHLPTFFLYRNDRGQYRLDLAPATEEKITELRNTHIALEHSEDKPLKSATNFKKEELEEMAEKAGLTLPAKISKTELYGQVVAACTWTTK